MAEAFLWHACASHPVCRFHILFASHISLRMCHEAFQGTQAPNDAAQKKYSMHICWAVFPCRFTPFSFEFLAKQVFYQLNGDVAMIGWGRSFASGVTTASCLIYPGGYLRAHPNGVPQGAAVSPASLVYGNIPYLCEKSIYPSVQMQPLT